MTPSRMRPEATLRVLSTLRHLLEKRSRGDQWLFEARGEAHQLAYEAGREGYNEFQPLCLAVRDLFGHLLRRGARDAEEILTAIQRLLGFLDQSLEPAMRVAASANDYAFGSAGGLSLKGGAVAAEALPPPLDSGPRPPQATETSAHPSAAPSIPQRVEGHEAWRLVNETRLGEILIRLGRIDGRTLDQALVLQQVGCKRLGEVLIGMGKISPEDLRAALDYQRELTLRLAGGISLGSALKLPTPSAG